MPDQPPWPWPDVAVLETNTDYGQIAIFDAKVPVKQTRLETYGFPFDADEGGEPGSAIFVGQAVRNFGESGTRYQLTTARLQRGTSGSPLFTTEADCSVVGMIVMGNNPNKESGGVALPAWEIVQALRDVVELNVRNSPEEPTPLKQPIETFGYVQIPKSASGNSTALSRPQMDATARVQGFIEASEAARRKLHFADALKAAKDATVEDLLSAAAPAIAARALRARAIALLVTASDFSEIKALATRALTLDQDSIASSRLNGDIALVEFNAEAALAALPAGLSAESDRLRAQYCLFAGRTSEADAILAALPSSESEKPQAKRSRLAVAVVLRRRPIMLDLADGLYAATRDDSITALYVIYALVLGSIPTVFWPNTVDVSTPPPVIHLADSVADAKQPARLRLALNIAEDLLSDPKLAEFHDHIRLWKLAALCLSEAPSDETAAVAKSLLSHRVPTFSAILWIWAFRLAVNTSPVIRRLEGRVKRGNATSEEIFVLVNNALRDEKFDKAIRILDKRLEVFVTADERSRRAVLKAQALIGKGHIDEASALADKVTSPTDRSGIERSLIHVGTDRSDAVKRLADRWAQTGDAISLLIACDIAHQIQDWTFLADHGKAVLAAFGTVAAARFAIYGAINTQRYTEVLERYAELAELNPGDIPVDILRIRALALDYLGDAAAIVAYGTLIDREPSDKNYFDAGYAQLRRGDYAGVAALGQQLLAVDGITAQTLFAFARWIRTSNVELARALWRRAMAQGMLPRNLVPIAFNIALQLDLGSETQSLQAPMAEIAASGEHGVQSMSREDLVEMLKAAAERQADLIGRYRRSTLPIHLVCENLNLNVFQTHVIQTRENARARADWMPIFVRHGARATDDALLVGKRSPYLDITSLLLAKDLDVLGLIVEHFGVIRVSQQTGPVLASIQDDLNDGELHIPAKRQFLDLVRTKRIRTIDGAHNLLDAAAAELDATICDWASAENEATHRTAQTRWISPRKLVDTLRARGFIDAITFDQALNALGNITEVAGDDLPIDGNLILSFNVATTLAEATLLERLSEKYTLFAESKFVDLVRSEIEQSDRNHQSAAWVGQLIEDYRAGLDAGAFLRVDRAVGTSPIDDSLMGRTLMSLFSPLPDDGFVVVDDRYSTVMPTREDGKPVVALWDVLHYLRLIDAIDPERYRRVVMQMRRRGLMYIPLTADEIVYYVSQMPIEDGFLAATEETRTLERYIARALLDREALYSITEVPPESQIVQVSFVMTMSIAIRSAIRQLLVDDSPESDARATWVYDHLSVDGLPGFGLTYFGGNSIPDSNIIDFDAASLLGDFLSS